MPHDHIDKLSGFVESGTPRTYAALAPGKSGPKQISQDLRQAVIGLADLAAAGSLQSMLTK